MNRFSVAIVRRSSGHSAVARAAYNARERLVDEKTQQVHDYRHLGETEWKGIFDPENAPGWVTDRARLWNEVERREDRSTRPDTAQLARDLKLSLPYELSAEHRLSMVKQFGEEMARKGMVVDAAIHAPHAHNHGDNVHAHMLLTLREAGPDGFGNKVRTWNRNTELDRWRQRWSEIGAQHLERGGFYQDADRFRTGHLPRPERAKLALQRGDLDEYEKLLNEPHRHRGPGASGMERRGVHTRIGDINREIDERNELRGKPREIREAYALAGNAHEFADALIKKDMMLSGITEDDARKSYSAEHRRFMHREGNYVVACEDGKAYGLSKFSTGASYKQIRDFVKPLDQHDYPSLSAALGELEKRRTIPKVDRAEVIQKMMTPEPPKIADQPNLMTRWLRDSMHDIANGKLPSIPGADLQRPPRSEVPYGPKHLDIRGSDGGQVWWAFNSTTNAEDFQNSVQERGLHLARVTATDAADSHTQHWAATRLGGYHPILREGEYVVLNDRNQAYRLHQHSVGHDPREIRVFLSKLDDKPVPSFREVRATIEAKRIQEIDARPSSDQRGIDVRSGIRSAVDAVTELPGAAAGSAIRAGRRALNFVSSIGDLFSPPLTPEQKIDRDARLEHRRMVDEQAIARQRQEDRGR